MVLRSLLRIFYVLVGKDDSLYFLIGCAERRKLRKCLEDIINYRISGFAEDRLHLKNIQINLVFYSVCTIFNDVLDTHARKNQIKFVFLLA